MKMAALYCGNFQMFKTKYRIVDLGYYFDIEEWDWYWPFWISTPATESYYADLEDAKRVVKRLIAQTRPSKRVVKEFF